MRKLSHREVKGCVFHFSAGARYSEQEPESSEPVCQRLDLGWYRNEEDPAPGAASRLLEAGGPTEPDQ